MRSNNCVIKRGGVGLENILSEVEKVSAYNALPRKEALRLRLLAEELVGMLPDLVNNFEGVFWAQNIDDLYELHVELALTQMSREKKDSILSVSASGKNAAAKGFMGKIREIAENMLLGADEANRGMFAYQNAYDYSTDLQYSSAWTLESYTEQFYRDERSTIAKARQEQGNDEREQLERSIVARLADDVIVGVRGKSVDIIIKKKF